jgi:RNA-binding protein 39
LNLLLNDNEKDIYKFFRDGKAGKIRDIKIIKDPITRRSKGIAYVEFYDQPSMI